MERIIKSMENKYLMPSLELVEDVFAKWDSPEEGRVVRSLVEEIRRYSLKGIPKIITPADFSRAINLG